MSDTSDPTDPVESPPLGLDLPEVAPPASPYRVLARKYRPQAFEQLIGQDAMVRTRYGEAGGATSGRSSPRGGDSTGPVGSEVSDIGSYLGIADGLVEA